MIMPMLAHAGPLPEGEGWTLEPKYDGFRMMADDAGRLWIGRNKVKLTGLTYLSEALQTMLPEDTEVDGELISPNDWGAVATVVKRLQGGKLTEHVPSADSPALEYVVFDAVRWAGEELRHRPFHERRGIIKAALREGAEGVVTVSAADEAFEGSRADYYGAMIEAGYEGVMAKHRDGLYAPSRIDSKGKPKSQRAPKSAMVKVKAQHTLDVVVTAIYPPEPGSWLDKEGLPGKVGFAMRGGPEVGKVGTGFTRKDRQAIDEAWVGKVIEIGHMTVEADAAAPRHPSFLRERFDKRPEEADETW